MPLLMMFALAVVLVVAWLLHPRQGTPHQWADAPGGALDFRLRLRSPLAALLWVARNGNCGLALWGVVHIREGWVSPSLLAHELGHLVRMRGNTWNYLWKYLVVASFRAAEEEACWEFAEEHRGDAVVLALAGRLGAESSIGN